MESILRALSDRFRSAGIAPPPQRWDVFLARLQKLATLCTGKADALFVAGGKMANIAAA
jgi:hypothetical protein